MEYDNHLKQAPFCNRDQVARNENCKENKITQHIETDVSMQPFLVTIVKRNQVQKRIIASSELLSR